MPDKYTTPAGGKTGKERAELYALAVQEREDETGDLLAKKRARQAEGNAESADTWHERYLAHCSERGLSTVGDKRYRWGKWIAPKIGHWVLEWSDVDLDDHTIRVTKAWDFKNKRTKGTKTHETRSVPIEPNLLPLLRRMHERAGGKGLVVPVLSGTNPDEIDPI